MHPTLNKILFIQPQGLVRNGLAAVYRFDEGSGQTLYDYWGNNHGTLGSTTAPDTNDPTWDEQGLSFVADDYCTHPISWMLSGTVMIAYKALETTPAWPTLITLDNVLLYTNAGGTIFDTICVPGNTSLGTITGLLPNVPYIAGTRWQPGNSSAGLNDNPSKAINNNVTVQSSTSYGRRIGNNGAGSYPLEGSIYAILIYNRYISDAEYKQNYRFLKSLLAQRGVSLP